ncbi:Uncharacterised protein [Porphyromonas crevioricanis]|uniref:Transmembrane protein n=1 Tax=Porphyromonas crevioricanis TaxID=393921 RepID=A0A2X4SHM5_9PORP|nr:hypothetical protein [Porphyromonas crevioricanis]SQH73472.1 Uncharacterised protein [Porphyromonas crevioricanis]
MKPETTNILLLVTCLIYTVLIIAGALITHMEDGLNHYGFVLLMLPTCIITWLIYVPYKAPQIIGVVLALMAVLGLRSCLNYEFPRVWEKGDFYFISLMILLLWTVVARVLLWIQK